MENQYNSVPTSILTSNIPQIIKISDALMQLRVFWLIELDSSNPSIKSARNKHTFTELHYILSGNLHLSIDTAEGVTEYNLGPNDFIFIPPNVYHSVTYVDENSRDFRLAFHFTTSNPELLETSRHLTEIQMYSAPPRIAHYFELIRECLNSKSSWRIPQATNLIECLLLDLLVSGNSGTSGHKFDEDNKTSFSRLVIAQAEEYIASHIEEEITVTDIAQHVCLSARQLNRICNKLKGVSVNRLIGSHKVIYIKTLIDTTALSFSEIAALTGFSCEYSLNRFFKSNTGITLGAYKKQFYADF